MKLHSISNKSARTRGAIQFLGFSYKTTGLPKKGVRNFHEVTWPWSESMSENVQGRQKLLCSRRGGGGAPIPFADRVDEPSSTCRRSCKFADKSTLDG